MLPRYKQNYEFEWAFSLIFFSFGFMYGQSLRGSQKLPLASKGFLRLKFPKIKKKKERKKAEGDFSFS